MSKAFTRESDDDVPELPRLRPASASLPPGVPNYLTADGAESLRRMLDDAIQNDRPSLQAAIRSGADKEPLQQLDQKIRLWTEILEGASVVATTPDPESRARFGSTITVRDPSGEEETYRIVGVDETDVDRGWISWISPLAKALVHTREGQTVHLQLPGGRRELTIVKIV